MKKEIQTPPCIIRFFKMNNEKFIEILRPCGTRDLINCSKIIGINLTININQEKNIYFYIPSAPTVRIDKLNETNAEKIYDEIKNFMLFEE